MSAITTHVLDTSRGAPISDLAVTLEVRFPDGAWQRLGHTLTNADGRANLLSEGVALAEGVYRITFDTRTPEGFYPEVTVTFHVRDTSRHYHVPLLLSPYGYTTYRGS